MKKIVQAEKGFSTLGARHIWYDDTVMRLNTDQRGLYLGAFKEDDKILTLTKSGFYKLMSFDLSNHFEEDMNFIEKFNPAKALTVLYYSDPKKAYFVKRFIPEPSDKKVCVFPEEDGNDFVKVVADKRPKIKVEYDNEGAKKPVEPEEIILDEFVEVMGVKAKGKKLSNHPVSLITWLDPIPVEEEEEDGGNDDESMDDSEDESGDDGTVEDGTGEDESGEDKSVEDESVEDEISGNESPETTGVESPADKKVVKEKVKKVKTEKVIIPKIIPPVKPPEFPDDDDSGLGIQMSLF